MKKLVTLTLAALVALIATACGDKNEPAAAGQIQQAAAEAAAAAEGSRAAHRTTMSTAAAALAGGADGDIEEARRLFGDVSRPLVGLLAADESLRAGRHLFSCPMAQDYDKWVQPNDTIENPYMGQRMLACGGPAKWH
jgi:membrane fusion protein, copper/silver efflux system